MADHSDRAPIDPRTLAVLPASSGILATLNPRITADGQWRHFDVHIRRDPRGPLEPNGSIRELDIAQSSAENALGEKLAWGEQIVQIELPGRRLRYAAFVGRSMRPPNVPADRGD